MSAVPELFLFEGGPGGGPAPGRSASTSTSRKDILPFEMGDEVRIPRFRGERKSRCMEVSLQREIAKIAAMSALERMILPLRLGRRHLILGTSSGGAPDPDAS